MSELRVKYLHSVVVIRDGSTSDGTYGLVTQIIERSQTPLTVTFWAMETMRHDNYYAVEDVELTDQAWNDNLPRDSQLRCVYDKNYTKLWYICSKGGRDINGYGTPGIAWAHWFKNDEATVALHRLVQEATNDPSSRSMESTDESDTTGSGKGDESIAADLEALGERCEPAKD